MSASPQAKYIVDSKGRRTAVVLSIKESEAMVRELDDLRDAQYVDEAEATAQGFVDMASLRADVERKAS